MKTFLTNGILALAFLSFNSFSQTAVAQANSGNVDVDQTIGGITSGGEVGTGLATSVYSRDLIFCDNFNVANTTTIAGWTEQSGDWQIFDNMLKTPGNSEWQYITVDGSSQADGCITGRAIYGTPAQVKFVGLVGRFTSLNSHILFKIQDNTDVGYWDSYWIYINGGNPTAVTGGNFGTDAIIQMEYSGANVTVRIDVDRDGTWDYTNALTVSNTDSGLCGVGAYANAYLDDFCCGADCGAPPPPIVPLSNVALYLALLLMVGFVAIRVYRMA